MAQVDHGKGIKGPPVDKERKGGRRCFITAKAQRGAELLGDRDPSGGNSYVPDDGERAFEGGRLALSTGKARQHDKFMSRRTVLRKGRPSRKIGQGEDRGIISAIKGFHRLHHRKAQPAKVAERLVTEKKLSK